MLLVTSVQASVDGDSEIVGDRPEASAQAATSTCVHVDTWGSLERLWKEGPPSQDWLVSACFEPETLAPTSGEERETRGPDGEGQHSREEWRLFQTPLRSDFAYCLVKPGIHVMCLSHPQASLQSTLAGWLGWYCRV